MPWATVDFGGAERIGLVRSGEIRVAADARSMIDLLVAGPDTMADLERTLLDRPAAVIALDEAYLHSPIPRPPAVRDALCFLDHMRGCMRALGRSDELGPVWDEIPAFYFGNPACVVGPTDDVAIAPGSQWFDFELEVAAVIGKSGRDIPTVDAGSHIAGYTFFCDWSARDLQVKDLALGLGQAKGKDSAITLGPFLVTAAEVADHWTDGRLELHVGASINGETFAEGTTASMDWTFEEVIAFCSRGTDLLPGDVIGSGTIPGACLLEHATEGLENTRWLQPDDVVSLYGPELGSTSQRIVPGASVCPLR